MPPASKNLEALEAEAREAIGAAATLQALTQVRARFLGRKGSVSEFLRGIGDLDTAERSRAGQAQGGGAVLTAGGFRSSEAWAHDGFSFLGCADGNRRPAMVAALGI